MKSWTVIYRMGGRENATWHTQGIHQSYECALAKAMEIERGGRKSLIHRTETLDKIGMPDGFDARDNWWEENACINDSLEFAKDKQE